tara:strand:+ start:76 stop:264 length:189 start_codon:yes stop_codon:yes gene_type:complete
MAVKKGKMPPELLEYFKKKNAKKGEKDEKTDDKSKDDNEKRKGAVEFAKNKARKRMEKKNNK